MLGSGGTDCAYDMERTADGGYILGGFTGFPPYSYDFLLIKTDSLFNEEWTSTFGGDGGEICFTVLQAADGGYLAGGRSESYGPTPDYYLVKTDADGELEWESHWGGGDWDEFEDSRLALDGGYLLLARREWDDITQIIRLDTDGTMLWEVSYPQDRLGKSFLETPDGGSVVCGTYAGNLWLMRTDSVGTMVWETSLNAGTMNEVGCDLCETPEGGYLVAGSQNTGASIFDLWMVCFESCTGIGGGTDVSPGLLLHPPHPNPAAGLVTVCYDLPECSDVRIGLFDVLGRLFCSREYTQRPRGANTYRWTPASGLPNGVYQLWLEACGQRAVQRCVLLR